MFHSVSAFSWPNKLFMSKPDNMPESMPLVLEPFNVLEVDVPPSKLDEPCSYFPSNFLAIPCML
jgi:hypothetical protein